MEPEDNEWKMDMTSGTWYPTQTVKFFEKRRNRISNELDTVGKAAVAQAV
jgi:hypothetical protein